MTGSTEPGRHALLAAADALREVMDRAVGANPAFLSTGEKASALRQLSRERERLDGLIMGVLAVSEDVAAENAARSSADWLANETRADYGPTARKARLAEALDGRWHQLCNAVSDGRVTVAQAEAISAALDALPRVVDRETRAKAEAHLIHEAGRHTPRQLRILGRKVLEVVAPDAFDDHERRLLEAEEALARRRMFLTARPNGDGTTDLKARLPDSSWERLRTYLEAYAAPRRGHLGARTAPAVADAADASTPAADLRSYPQRLGAAFCALLEHLPGEVLPQHGGTATTVVVTIGLDQLRDRLGGADLASGGRISVEEARRLACTAGVIPAVMGGPSQPLDLGRSSRLFSPAQRHALLIRDVRCRAEGCTIPGAWTEAHHLDPWSQHGLTNLEDGILLCSHHHHRAHDRRYEQSRLPSGDIRFHRRT